MRKNRRSGCGSKYVRNGSKKQNKFGSTKTKRKSMPRDTWITPFNSATWGTSRNTKPHSKDCRVIRHSWRIG